MNWFSLKVKNRLIDYIIRTLSVVVVLSLICIAGNFIWVALPLFMDPTSELKNEYQLNNFNNQDGTPAKIGFIPDQAVLFIISDKGGVSFLDLETKQIIASRPLRPGFDDPPLELTLNSKNQIGVFYADQQAYLLEPTISADGQPSLTVLQDFTITKPSEIKLAKAVWQNGKFGLLVVYNNLQAELWQTNNRQTFAGDIIQETARFNFEPKSKQPTDILLNADAEVIYIIDQQGLVENWRVKEGQLDFNWIERVSSHRIMSSQFVFGDISLFLSLDDGSKLLVSPAPTATDRAQGSFLQFRQVIPPQDIPFFDSLKHTQINRNIIGQYAQDKIRFIYTTTGRRLLDLESKFPIVDYTVDVYQENLAILTDQQTVELHEVKIPFPEASLKSFFGKLFYENYPAESYTWQSSASQDDFEPKLSFIPLIIGSLKGTFYAMLMVIPLSVLGAIYLSQFAAPKLRQIFKPIIEITSSMPSVVIGFLAALWLAPNLERHFLAFLLFWPTFLLVHFVVYQLQYSKPLLRFKESLEGWEFLLALPSMLASIIIANYISDYLHHSYFSDGFVNWLFSSFDVRYEQQNAIVTAMALGFAAMPLIFTIVDDALNTVPEYLKAGSLALGASRWETVLRIVVPTASPGIFAALILGASRAIGETMDCAHGKRQYPHY